jgi:hypothetical protein
MFSRSLAGFLAVFLVSGNLKADDPKLPDAKTYDKLVVDALRDVHNTGADLYNVTKDFAGAYRVYQGALLTVRPLLAHQPNAQKLIDTGLAEADKEHTIAMKAFKLHETMESVRTLLKTGGMAPTKPNETAKPIEKKPMETADTKKTVEKKPMEPIDIKKPEEKKPVVTYELAPQPREKK